MILDQIDSGFNAGILAGIVKCLVLEHNMLKIISKQITIDPATSYDTEILVDQQPEGSGKRYVPPWKRNRNVHDYVDLDAAMKADDNLSPGSTPRNTHDRTKDIKINDSDYLGTLDLTNAPQPTRVSDHPEINNMKHRLNGINDSIYKLQMMFADLTEMVNNL